jgi:transposase
MGIINERENWGIVIAARCKIDRRGDAWIVPSQSGPGKYAVHLDGDSSSCTCPDHDLRGVKCKHIFAVEIVSKREENPDGSETLTKTITVKETVRKTYKQDWPAYNAAQTHEKEKYLMLLQDLCSGVQEPPAARTGRKPIPRADGIFAACYKVYSGFSTRRFMSDLRTAKEDGFIRSEICYNSIINFLENPALTPILKAMILEASRPLASVEVDFAGDSTGFMTTRYDRWFDHKYGTPKKRQDWVKLHFTTGVKTNVVTAVVIKDKDAFDGLQLPEMVDQTKENFTIKEYSADKAYGSRENFDSIDKAGGTGFIAFKSNATGAVGGMYEKMFHYFSFRRDEFLGHYHKRSNVESTVSMMKRKFGDSVRSKTDTAMVNETLCKVLCHNIVVLIHEMYELGIEPVFWEKLAAQKPATQPINAVTAGS